MTRPPDASEVGRSAHGFGRRDAHRMPGKMLIEGIGDEGRRLGHTHERIVDGAAIEDQTVGSDDEDGGGNIDVQFACDGRLRVNDLATQPRSRCQAMFSSADSCRLG